VALGKYLIIELVEVGYKKSICFCSTQELVLQIFVDSSGSSIDFLFDITSKLDGWIFGFWASNTLARGPRFWA
jgi:hypothetical protein